MKTKNVMKRAMLLAWAMLAVCTISNCKSENEETKLPASKIIVGNWEQASVKVTDQNGNDIPLSTIEDIFVNISSSLTFDDNGTYTASYLDGTTRTGSWYVSDDETYLTIGDESWEIYSFNENELILAQEIQYNNSTYYVIYTYNKSSATEGQPEETPDENTEEGQSNTPPLTNLGSISDNNPYKPWGKNLVSKITEQTKNILQIHYFQYDKNWNLQKQKVKEKKE